MTLGGFALSAWRWQRVLTTFLGLVGFVLWPLMPPRLLPESYGFVDTLGAIPDGLWSFDSGALEHHLQPVPRPCPAFHFTWALWCTFVFLSLLRHPLARLAATAYVPLTLAAIVLTGNHFILDAAAGRRPGDRLARRPAGFARRRGACPAARRRRRRAAVRAGEMAGGGPDAGRAVVAGELPPQEQGGLVRAGQRHLLGGFGGGEAPLGLRPPVLRRHRHPPAPPDGVSGALYGELAIGLGLVAGFLTPVAAVAGLILNLSYFVLGIHDWAERGRT